MYSIGYEKSSLLGSKKNVYWLSEWKGGNKHRTKVKFFYNGLCIYGRT